MKKVFLLALLCLPLQANAADCFISYYRNLGQATNGVAQMPVEPALEVEKVTFTTTSVSSGGDFPTGVQLVGFVCNAAVTHFAVGTAPTATTNHPYVPADVWFWFGTSTATMKIAFRTP